MRLLRIALCLLIFSASAAAQSTTSSPQSESGQNPAQQPGQTPQSPLADQPTSQQQQQQAQTEAQKPKAATFDVSGATTGEQDQELGEIRMMTRYSQVGGGPQGRVRSFHNEGSNNLAEFNYFLDHRLFGSTYRFQFLSMFRGTDDTSIDPERNSVQKGYVRIYNPRNEFIFGDALVNYSRLTFNQNVKGVSATTRIGDRWKFSTVGGVFIDRYGSLFKEQPLYVGNYTDPTTGLTSQAQFGCFQPAGSTQKFVALNDPQCGRPFTALVSGARLEYALARDSAIGFNMSTSDDLTFTRRDQPFNTSPLPASNRVGSIDWKWQKGMFRMDSEFAYSATDFDTRGTNCVAPCDSRMPTPGLGYQGDWGGRYDASYRRHKWTFRSSYVRYQPNFASINARQISDLQDFLFRASYDLADWLTVDGTMRRTNDDLKGQNLYEKTLWGPEGRFMFHDLPFYRKAVFEVGYRHRIIDGFNSVAQFTVDPVTSAKTITAGCVKQSSGAGMVCVDRYLRQPYVELTLPFHTTFLTVGYERRQSVDLLQQGTTSNTDRIYAGFRGIYDLAGWHINPSLRYELERQGSRPGLANVLPGNTPSAIDLFLLRESNRLASASVYIETPRWFIAELQFRDNSSTSQAGYSRPSYRANLTYKIANDENKLFVFSFERNNNFYYSNLYPPSGALNPINFDERLIGVTFVYKFGKRAR
jgi:hypothetical protein